ncbi:MAG: UDP-N-acetylmuramoyl-L-alanyl-D-glutamate--2,6-diaminopimelate ligase [Acidimicrobiales bacterium]
MSARLDAVAARLDVEPPARDSAVVVDDVHHDSRHVGPNALFCCVPGVHADGHDHAPAAVRAGAVALLVERPLRLGVPEIVVPSVRRAMGPAAALVHGDPSRAISVVGVTGTNGKTTTVRLVTAILGELGVRAREIGTLTGARTTPEAPELQRILADARRAGDEVVAMEVSSHALDQYRVDGTHFRVVGFTNLGVDHLDHHGTIDDYFAAKRRLFTDGFGELAVIDTRGVWGRSLADGLEMPYVTIDAAHLVGAETGPLSSTFEWRGVRVDLPLAGMFNVANAIMAAEIVHGLGFGPAEIAGALARAPTVPGRFETIEEGQDFVVVVDYAHTPDGLEAVLAAAREITERRLVVVFGAGGDRDRSKRPQMGEVARRLADRVVVTSDNPRGESPEAIIAGIVSGMERPPELVEVDRRAAIRHALAGARKGDVVLIAGKGHESTQTIGDEVTEFDDRDVARDELRRLGGRRP